jgi:hypothetical protein
MITEGYAYDVYGVVIQDGAIDKVATDTQRSALRATESSNEGHLRHFYESIKIDPIRDAPSLATKQR